MRAVPDIIEFTTNPDLLGLSLSPAQETLLRAIYGLPLASDEQVELWRLCTGREEYPGTPFPEVTCISGARGGKDSRIAAPIVLYEAVYGYHDEYLASGRVSVMHPRASPNTYDLQERLIDLAVSVSSICESLPPTRIGKHVAGQIVRCGTAPAPLHSEAQAAESRKDFIHKLGLCLKELRETISWRSFEENDGAVAIVFASIRTAKRNQSLQS